MNPQFRLAILLTCIGRIRAQAPTNRLAQGHTQRQRRATPLQRDGNAALHAEARNSPAFTLASTSRGRAGHPRTKAARSRSNAEWQRRARAPPRLRRALLRRRPPKSAARKTMLPSPSPRRAFAYKMDRDPKILAAAKHYMDAAVSYDIWGYSLSKPNTDLAAGHLLYGMGVAYDLLYNDLTPAERTKYRDCISPPRPPDVRVLRAQARPHLCLLAEPYVHPHGRARRRGLRSLRRGSRGRAVGRALSCHLRPRARHLLAGWLLLRRLRVLDFRNAVDHSLPRRAEACHRRRPLRPTGSAPHRTCTLRMRFCPAGSRCSTSAMSSTAPSPVPNRARTTNVATPTAISSRTTTLLYDLAREFHDV